MTTQSEETADHPPMPRAAADSPGPVFVSWGEELYTFFNDHAILNMGDHYEPPLGGRHTQVLQKAWASGELSGLPAKVWAGTRASVPLAHLPHARAGKVEDAWFDLHYTSIRGHAGVVGLTVIAFNRTEQVLAARRLQMVSRLAAMPAASDRREALEQSLGMLDQADIPFAAAYLFDPAGSRAGLITAAGVDAGAAMASAEQRVAPGGGWPLEQAVGTRCPILVEDADARFRSNGPACRPSDGKR